MPSAVPYVLLPQLLKNEGTSFHRLDKRWRPQSLLFVQQVRRLLRDMSQRYEHLAEARDEFETLVYANVYTKLLQNMRLLVRKAGFVWKADHLAFIVATSHFYDSYGAVLRLLKIEEARGRFADRPAVKQGV